VFNFSKPKAMHNFNLLLSLFIKNKFKKYSLVMRFIFTLTVVCLISATASVYSQNTLFTFSVEGKTIKDVFRLIEKESQFRFLYNDDFIDLDQRVKLDANKNRVEDILNQLLGDSGVTYQVLENNLIVITPVPMLIRQGIMINGTVTDETGEPMPGVNVMVKGTSTGAVTDINGRYSINVSDGNVILVFSFMGYMVQELAVNDQTSINVILSEDVREIEEVVVVGYGTQKRGSVLGAVTSIRADAIADIPASNLSNALGGRLAGVTILSSAGKPGASSDIQIRAVGSMNSSGPLYVIDGIVSDKFAFDGLDVSEIESLSVLKDGASSAVYGVRAANGVVIVSTKKGRAGKPVISYNGSVGIDSPIKIPKTMSAWDQATIINNSLRSRGLDETNQGWYTDDELEHFKTHSYNWIEDAWKNPTTTNHALNVSGGGDRIKYFVGGSLWMGTGSFNNLDYKRYNFRANIEAEITKGLTATMNLSTVTREDQKPYWEYDGDNDNMSDLYKGLLYRSAIVPPYINGLPVGNNNEWHPLELLTDRTGYNKKKWQEVNIIVSLEYELPFIKGLSVKATYNKFTKNQFQKQFSLPYTLYNFNTLGRHGHIVGDQVVSTKIRNDGEFLRNRYYNDESYQLNGYLTYNKDFGLHSVGALFVYEQSESTNVNFQGRRNYFISPQIDQMFGGSADVKDSSVDGGAGESGRISYVGRISYNYDQKYLLEASFRYDGSQRFALDKRWGFFPSASVGWRISKESFMSSINWLNDLKLRGSVGLLGQDNIASWQWYQSYTISAPGAILGDGLTPGIAPGAISNPDITWEKSLNYNFGIDATVFKSVILDFNIFKRHQYDIFGSRTETAPTTFGAAFPSENYGVVDSHGFELEIGYAGMINNEIRYHVSGNFAYAINKIIKWDEAANIRPYRSRIGKSTDAIWGYQAKGILRTQEQIDALPAGYQIFSQVPQLGMMDVQDFRSLLDDVPDNMVDSNDETLIAKHSTPPVNYGFSFGGSWKGISFDVVFQGFAGYYNMTNQRNVQLRPEESGFAFWNDHWTPENPNASMPRPRNDTGVIRETTFWLRNNSFLRCKNLTLSYDIPKYILSAVRIERARIYFTGTNLFLLEDHIKWRDPEANSLNSYPLMKNFSLGLNITI
jgi:TonB-linked SusC/RagA family outer membrane protein